MIKFGFVGAISFVVDMGVFTLLCNVLEWNYLFSGICSFVVSVIVNYILSMKYVFQPREDTSKIREFPTGFLAPVQLFRFLSIIN